MKFLGVIAVLLLVGCGEVSEKTVTEYVDVYVDRNVTEYVDVYVDRNVTEYVDRNVTEYVDRNVTEYVDVYVDREVIVEVFVEVFVESSVCDLQEYDSEFVGRIVYKDLSPYKRGTVRAQGSTWVSQAITDDNGTFRVSVKGDDRFFFSAYSPYGDYMFYPYKIPLVVPQYSISEAYDCEYNEELLMCYETNTTIG